MAKIYVDLLQESGLSGMRSATSNTAQYGDLTRGSRIITKETREEMKKIPAEIQSGQFAREWIMENQTNQPVFKSLTKKDEEHLIEKVGKKLRGMMSWIKEE